MGTKERPLNRKRMQRLMRKMGIAALHPKPRTTKPQPGHKIFPYLLRNMTIDRPNQVWAADITYVPIGRGFLYLVAIMDWASRAVLSWRLSNTMDVSFCVSALEEALARFGTPEIFNTDQGSQFTSADFTGTLAKAAIRISMDGRGRWMDNVFIERLWRSLKHEDIYLKGYADGREARAGIGQWIAFYNTQRPHQALGYCTPMAVWRAGITGARNDAAVDMTLRLDNAITLPTCPQPQQQAAWIGNVDPGAFRVAAIDEGAPVRLVWNQGLYGIEGWTIPKGNPKRELGQKFIQYCARPDRQAAFAEIISYGPTNPKAFEFIDKSRAEILPTAPSHFDKLIYQDHNYWSKNQEEALEKFNAWLLG